MLSRLNVRTQCLQLLFAASKALPEQIAANSEMAGPQCEKFRKNPIGAAPTTFQVLLFNKLKAQLAEFQSIFMIAEVVCARSCQTIRKRGTNRHCCHAQG